MGQSILDIVASMRIETRFVHRWPEHPCLSLGMGAGVG